MNVTEYRSKLPKIHFDRSESDPEEVFEKKKKKRNKSLFSQLSV